MSKIKTDNNTTIVGGTEMSTKDVAYIIPVGAIIIGLIFLFAGSKIGWIIFICGLLFTGVVAYTNHVAKK